MLLAATGCAAPTAAGGAGGLAAIVDLTSSFLDRACRAPAGDAFARAWLDDERAHFDVLSPTYYADGESLGEREAMAAELGPRRDEMCGHARAFRIAAPAVVAGLRPRLAELFGAPAAAPVYFVAALQWTDGRTVAIDGRDAVVLNARHDTFARTTGLVATVAHELAHAAQAARVAGADRALAPVARSLYREGAAVHAVTLLLPELGARATGVKADDRPRAERMLPYAAAELRAQLRHPSAEPSLRRFFSGGVSDPVYPAKMGYVAGARIYAALGPGALRVSPAEFVDRADAVLAELARGLPLPPPPPDDDPSLLALRQRLFARAGVASPPEGKTPPVLDKLDPRVRERIVTLAGSPEATPWAFAWLFRWFRAPHEAAHALQEQLGVAVGPPALREQEAIDLAVAFLRAEPDGRARLLALEPFLVAVDERSPILLDVESYGGVEARQLLDALHRIDVLDFEEIVGTMRARQ